jgi:hypothetical protein
VHGEASAAAQHWLNALQRGWGVQALPRRWQRALPERGEIGVWSRSDALPPNWQAWLRDGGSVLIAAKPATEARRPAQRRRRAAVVAATCRPWPPAVTTG